MGSPVHHSSLACGCGFADDMLVVVCPKHDNPIDQRIVEGLKKAIEKMANEPRVLTPPAEALDLPSLSTSGDGNHE